nr:T-cell surface glycoprotein CD1a isoform X3 [Oryctolagus cuniculus]
MLFLFLPLLAALLPGSDNKVGLEEPVSFQVTQTLCFYNRSCVHSLGSGWLGDLETHRREDVSGTIVYLWPWSRGNFSNKELTEFETFFHSYYSRYIMEIHNFARQLKYECLTETVHRILSDTCPRFLLGLLDAGKADIQQKVKPEAWLSSGPSPGPGRLLLVCHVSGFYPKPVWVMWMRGDQEQPRTQPRDLLPNADRTWYLRVTLDVAAGEASGLSCRVKHSSLGDQDIILHWDHHNPTGFIFLAVIMLVALLAGLAFWLRKCWIHHGPLRTLLPLQ